jgi:hypothetical protein
VIAILFFLMDIILLILKTFVIENEIIGIGTVMLLFVGANNQAYQ